MHDLPPNSEEKRLADLAAINIMDTLPEMAYDDIATLASYICETPIAYISFFDDKRQWYKSRVNLPFTETTLDEALCSYTIQQKDLLQVPDLTVDERFKNNPFVRPEDGIRFYAGYPLINSEGSTLGTLCVVDFKARHLNEQQKFALEALGRQAIAQLELRRILNHSNHQALHDSLTELPNRLLLFERLAQACREAAQNGRTCAALFIDLDHFKDINDTFGHEAGDTALTTVAERLSSILRREDMVGRYGGDEFVAVIHNLPNKEAAEKIIQSIHDVLAKPFTVGKKKVHLQTSIGVALFPEHAESGEELVRNADAALYKAKQAGRGTHRFFEPN